MNEIEVLKNHILYVKLLPKLKDFLSINKYELYDVAYNGKKIEEISKEKFIEVLGIIKTLELIFAENTLDKFTLEARSASGRCIELIDLQLRKFIREEVDRVLNMLKDLSKLVKIA